MTMSVAEHHAHRRAWLSLLLFPLSFVAAFVVGEGLATLFGYSSGSEESAPLWVMLDAGVPAVLVFAVPAAVTWFFVVRAGHEDVHRTRLPAYLATALAGVFLLMNLASGVAVAWLE